MAVHELKILPQFFIDVCRGNKTFEIRKDDRGYSVGDLLVLKEWENETFTGRETIVEVTYKTNYAQRENYVVLAICEATLGTLNKHFEVDRALIISNGYDYHWTMNMDDSEAKRFADTIRY